MKWSRTADGDYQSGDWRVTKSVGPYGGMCWNLYRPGAYVAGFPLLKEAKAAAEKKQALGTD